ncbi:MAG: phosphotransferase [Dehalococcoidia bacterium]
MDADQCRRVLAAAIRALEIEDVCYLAEGWDSTVFLVNESLLFRFPKRAEVAAALECELRLLPELGPTLAPPIPQFRYVVRDHPAYPWTFAGYPLIDGVPADQTALDETATLALAQQAGRFLRQLHTFPVARALALGVQPAYVAGGPDQLRTFAAATRERLAPLLTQDEQRHLADWFVQAEARGLLDFAPTLVHNDLGIEHLLVDPASSALTGVIDFGDAGIGDPAIDFVGILGGLGEAATRVALVTYGRPDDAALLARARLYRAMIPLHEVLFGLSTDDGEHIERGLSALRACLLAGVRPAG